MSIRNLERFVAETDDIKDFKLLLKTALKVKFPAGANEKPEFNVIKLFKNGKSYGYWNSHFKEKEENTGRVLVCTIAKYVGDNMMNDRDLAVVPMRRAKTGSKDMFRQFKWTNYGDIINIVLDQLNGQSGNASVPKWMLDGDGSTGVSYKIECDHNQMYITVGYCYYGK